MNFGKQTFFPRNLTHRMLFNIPNNVDFSLCSAQSSPSVSLLSAWFLLERIFCTKTLEKIGIKVANPSPGWIQTTDGEGLPSDPGFFRCHPGNSRCHIHSSETFLGFSKLVLISSLILKHFVPLVLLPKHSWNQNTSQASPGLNFASFLPESLKILLGVHPFLAKPAPSTSFAAKPSDPLLAHSKPESLLEFLKSQVLPCKSVDSSFL